MSDQHTAQDETDETAPDEAVPEENAAADREHALVVEDLTKIYDDGTLAVDDISFAVREGEFCVLIGPSGCGKSTTLHSIVGTVDPTGGRIVVGGEDVTDVPTYRRDIGLVFQDFQLFPHMNVAENVAYGLERMGVSGEERAERVDDTLSLLRLDDIRDRPPAELSAGQRQRVALGRSLVLEPALLLLDEPLGDLDYKLQKFMERELLRLHRELDTTFAYVTHDQTQAMRLGDRIVVMNDGRIEQSDTVEAVYNRPATAFVATFVGDTNVFYGELAAVEDGRGVVDTDYGRFAVSTANLRSPPESLVGERLVFVVRPQSVAFDPDADNTIACTVTDAIRRPGRGTQVLLETAGRGGSEILEESRPERGANATREESEAPEQSRSETPQESRDERDEQGASVPSRSLQLRAYEELSFDDREVVVGWDVEDTILLEEISVAEDVDLETDILGE